MYLLETLTIEPYALGYSSCQALFHTLITGVISIQEITGSI